MADDARRALPSVEVVAAELRDAAPPLAGALPHAVLVDCARRAVEAARDAIATGEWSAAEPTEAIPALGRIVAHARQLARERELQLLQPVINATGVLLHTNLGRAQLGATAIAAVTAAAGATNLEYRLGDGTRGSRHDHAGDLLALACGAEAGIVVNNNAAAVVLTLAALARGREVVVSRGELVEIGGGFRIPEILAETGAHMVEVGTTNRTRFADYEHATSDATALVLKVHALNYRMIGFTETTPVRELSHLDVPVVVDAGSGLLDTRTPWLDAAPEWLRDEPGVRQCLDDGAALVTFSGDKLLGGPQAGIVVGRRDLVTRLARHPLARALRADKLTLAALQAVALAYLAGDGAAIPLWSAATASPQSLHARAGAIAADITGACIVDTEAAAGGGSLPGLTIPSVGVAIAVASPSAAMRLLRVDHRVVARVESGSVVCDLRSVDPADDARLTAALRAVASELGASASGA